MTLFTKLQQQTAEVEAALGRFNAGPLPAPLDAEKAVKEIERAAAGEC
jgi:hypothetical protein